jgi:hypothetical protein
MPLITLRTKLGVASETDLTVQVKDNTYEYLLTSDAPSIRVSCYLDRDCPNVVASYEELYVSADCAFESKVTRVTPGSRTRKDIRLPTAMYKDEQLTVEVKRTPRV